MTTKPVRAADLVGTTAVRSLTARDIAAKGETGDGSDASSLFCRAAEVREVDADARTVDLAFSSEEPVERWFGDEILSHGDGAVRLDRLNNGAALLADHNRRDQIGVVVEARIDGDGVGRAKVRFGNSARAQEWFADVRDGIRQHVSVGYEIHAVDVELREGEPDRVTITDWEPLEISIVSVPADPTVGVGREKGAGKAPEDRPEATREDGSQSGSAPADPTSRSDTMNIKILRNAKGDLVRAKVDENGAIVEEIEVLERADDFTAAVNARGSSAERTRTTSLMELGEQYGAEDLARDYVREGKSVDQMRDALLERTQKGNGASDSRQSDVGLTDAEVQKFSFVRALSALANPHDRRSQDAASFEFDCSRAAAEKMGRAAEGIMVPHEVLSRAMNTGTGGGTAGATGGNSISTDLLAQSFIQMLKNRAVMMRLATPMGGLVGDVDIPSQIDASTGYWIGEDEEAPETGAELGQVSMSPKTVAAYTEITRKLLKQSSLDVEALMRRDLAQALALKIDEASIYGTGGAQPLGIVNLPGLGLVDFAGTTPTYQECVDMESEIAASNADVSSMAYLLGARMRGRLKTTEKFPGTSGQPVWEAGNTVNGYGAEVTNQVKNGDLLFGNFADLFIGMWGGLDINVDPYSESKRGRLRIVMMQDVDAVARHVESFSYGRQAA